MVIKVSSDKLDNLLDAIKNQKLFSFFKNIGEWEYDKAVEKWGTKWEADSISYDIKKRSNKWVTVQIYFLSAWSPPEKVYEAMLDILWLQFVRAYYYEGGMGLCGQFTENKGLHYQEYDISKVPYSLAKELSLDEQDCYEAKVIDGRRYYVIRNADNE